MKTIVIPIDFSKNSLKAVEFAFDFFNKKGNKFIFCHIYNIPVGGQSGLFSLTEQIKIQAEKDTKDFEELIKNEHTNSLVETEYHCVLGVLIGNIANIAKSNKADFIVMGAKGVSGVEEILIGSNTAKLIKNTNIPVFAIPSNYKKENIKNITFSYDGKTIHTEEVEVINSISKPNNLTINLFHVRKAEESPIQNWAEIEKQFNNKHISLQEVAGKSYEEGLKKSVNELDSILVLIRRKKSFWQDLFNASDSQNVVKHFQLPILVIPEG